MFSNFWQVLYFQIKCMPRIFQERKKELQKDKRKRTNRWHHLLGLHIAIMKCKTRSNFQSLNVTLLRNSQMIVCSTTVHFSLLLGWKRNFLCVDICSVRYIILTFIVFIIIITLLKKHVILYNHRLTFRYTDMQNITNKSKQVNLYTSYHSWVQLNELQNTSALTANKQVINFAY